MLLIIILWWCCSRKRVDNLLQIRLGSLKVEPTTKIFPSLQWDKHEFPDKINMKVNSHKHCPPNCKFHYKTIVQMPTRQTRSSSAGVAQSRKKSTQQPKASTVKNRPVGHAFNGSIEQDSEAKLWVRAASVSEVNSGKETKPSTTDKSCKVRQFYNLPEERSPDRVS